MVYRETHAMRRRRRIRYKPPVFSGELSGLKKLALYFLPTERWARSPRKREHCARIFIHRIGIGSSRASVSPSACPRSSTILDPISPCVPPNWRRVIYVCYVTINSGQSLRRGYAKCELILKRLKRFFFSYLINLEPMFSREILEF